jgi:hypothetical protein
MSWTRLDDTWGDDPVFDDLDFATRWHYLMLIQLCSRSDRRDGVIPLRKASNCSDVDDSAACIGALITAGLVENIDGATIRVVRIAAHVPSADLLRRLANDKDRAARHRKHKAGDHSDCSPERCLDANPALPVTASPVPSPSRASREEQRDASRDGSWDEDTADEYFAERDAS